MDRRVRKASRRGAAAVEAALVLGLALTMIFGIFEYGRVLFLRQLLRAASSEGARMAVSSTATKTTDQIKAAVTAKLQGQSLSNIVVQVYQVDSTGNLVGVWSDATFGSGVAVEVSATTRPFVAPLSLLPDPLTIQTRTILGSEAN